MTSTREFDRLQLEAEEHDQLRALFQRVREALLNTQGPRADLSEMLRLQVDAVLVHFDHEAEEHGLFDQLIARQPGVTHQAAELRREHFDLRSQLFGIEKRAAEAHAASADWHELQRRFVDFERQFQRHEADETRLLQSVFNHDLGPGA